MQNATKLDTHRPVDPDRSQIEEASDPMSSYVPTWYDGHSFGINRGKLLACLTIVKRRVRRGKRGNRVCDSCGTNERRRKGGRRKEEGGREGG